MQSHGIFPPTQTGFLRIHRPNSRARCFQPLTNAPGALWSGAFRLQQSNDIWIFSSGPNFHRPPHTNVGHLSADPAAGFTVSRSCHIPASGTTFAPSRKFATMFGIASKIDFLNQLLGKIAVPSHCLRTCCHRLLCTLAIVSLHIHPTSTNEDIRESAHATRTFSPAIVSLHGISSLDSVRYNITSLHGSK